RLGDAERYRDQVDEKEGPQAEADRHRQLLLDQLPDVLVVEEASPEVEARELAEHLHEALVRRLVETVELLDLVDLLRVDALPAAVAGESGRRPGGAAAGFAAAAFTALELRHHLLDRAAGHELDDAVRDEQDPEE